MPNTIAHRAPSPSAADGEGIPGAHVIRIFDEEERSLAERRAVEAAARLAEQATRAPARTGGRETVGYSYD